MTPTVYKFVYKLSYLILIHLDKKQVLDETASSINIRLGQIPAPGVPIIEPAPFLNVVHLTLTNIRQNECYG